MVEIGAGVAERQRWLLDRKKTKHVLAPLGGNPGAISPNFYVSAHHLLYIPSYIQIRSSLGSYNEITPK